jgi:hypothetical protein
VFSKVLLSHRKMENSLITSNNNFEFVHTSSFSIPIENQHEKNEADFENLIENDIGGSELFMLKQELQELKVLLKHSLETNANLATENTKLNSDNLALKDKLNIFLATELREKDENVPTDVYQNKTATSLLISFDHNALDAAICTVRGKLLEQSRDENRLLGQKLNESTLELQSLKEALICEKAYGAIAKRERTKAVKTLYDVSALSSARARAIEKLDSELTSVRYEMSNFDDRQKQTEEKLRQAQGNVATLVDQVEDLKQQLEKAKDANERLTERLIQQGMDLRVVKSHVQIGQAIRGENSGSRPDTSIFARGQQYGQIELMQEELQNRENAHARQISLLKKELEFLRNSQSTVNPTEKLVKLTREKLAQAIEELKLTSIERTRERVYFNACLAAYTARLRSLQKQVKKSAYLKKELKWYKFVARKVQAEMASKTAQKLLLSKEAKIDEY